MLHMRSPSLLLLLFATTLFATSSRAEDMVATTSAGTRISVTADFPPGDGPHPGLVLAPGTGYHMSLPAMEATARALNEQGVAVFRFNWSYFTAQPKGQPSEDLSKELQDIQAVLSAARKHPKSLANNFSIGGKSLGSIVAWRTFIADPSLRSGLFLTPVCSRVPKGELLPNPVAQQNYPGLDTERRPVLFILGDKDTLCATAVLYKFAGANAEIARVAIVGGDHGYEDKALPPAAGDAARSRNIAAVAVLAASFVAELSSAVSSNAP
jgi:predicted alpha/beta-hydrolase family hydrolase